MKVGIGLPVDDLPDHYPFKALVLRHMNKISGKRVEDGVFECIVDTTFALYRTREAFGNWQLPALRTGRPYVFRHVDWYVDPENLSDEEIYYLDHASNVATYAGLMRQWFRERNRDWHSTRRPHSKLQEWRDKLWIRARELLTNKQRPSKG